MSGKILFVYELNFHDISSYQGEIIPESGEYHMRYPRRAKRSLQQDPFVLQKILKHKDVESAEQLVEKIRVKRDHSAR